MSRAPDMHTLAQIVQSSVQAISPPLPPEAKKKALTQDQIKELEETGAAVSNSLVTIHAGISGIGRLLAGVGDNSGGDTINADILDSSTLRDIGFLLDGLGLLALNLAVVAEDVSHIESENEKLIQHSSKKTTH